MSFTLKCDNDNYNNKNHTPYTQNNLQQRHKSHRSSKVVRSTLHLSVLLTIGWVSFSGVVIHPVATLHSQETILYPLESIILQNVSGMDSNRNKTTITILIDSNEREPPYPFSLIETGHLQRYGKSSYRIVNVNFTNQIEISTILQEQLQQPCILTSRIHDDIERAHQMAPHCFRWNPNDEMCRKDQDEIRNYFHKPNSTTNTGTTSLYMPLGPRSDFFRIYQSAGFDRLPSLPPADTVGMVNVSSSFPPLKNLTPTSQRPLLYNAVFSQGTSPTRTQLVNQLTTSKLIQKNPSWFFIKIAPRWQINVTKRTGHISPERYIRVLAKSMFTIAPTGHNPECFRMYESLLMGSIPVLVTSGDAQYVHHACSDALEPMLSFRVSNKPGKQVYDDATGSPFLILENWTQLDATISDWLEKGPEWLDAKQQNMQEWYDRFMGMKVLALEQLVGTQPLN